MCRVIFFNLFSSSPPEQIGFIWPAKVNPQGWLVVWGGGDGLPGRWFTFCAETVSIFRLFFCQRKLTAAFGRFFGLVFRRLSKSSVRREGYPDPTAASGPGGCGLGVKPPPCHLLARPGLSCPFSSFKGRSLCCVSFFFAKSYAWMHALAGACPTSSSGVPLGA